MESNHPSNKKVLAFSPYVKPHSCICVDFPLNACDLSSSSLSSLKSWWRPTRPLSTFLKWARRPLFGVRSKSHASMLFSRYDLCTCAVSCPDWRMASTDAFCIRDFQDRAQKREKKIGKAYDIWHYYTTALQTIALSISVRHPCNTVYTRDS